MVRSKLTCAPEEASDGVVQMAWARDALSRRSAYIKEVARGAACGCVCLGCDAPVVARKGKTAHHFAHKAETSRCTPALVASAWESELHRLAKDVVAENAEIYLPELVARRFGKEWGLRPRRLIAYQQTHREHEAVRALALEGIVPDAVVYVEGHPLSIEIRVTNESRERKRARMAAQRLHGIEIDLRGLERFASRAEIAEAVLDAAPREWLYHRDLAPALAAIEAEVSAEERAAQARLDAAIAAVTEAYDAQRGTAATLRADLLRAGLGSVIGLGIQGQHCMRETAASWQARVLNLLFGPAKGTTITSGAVFTAIEQVALHPAFDAASRWNDKVLRGLRERFENFQMPDAVVAGYLEALGRRGILRLADPYRGDAWRVSFNLAAKLKEVEEAERRLGAVRDLAAELVSMSGMPFDLDAWMESEQPLLQASPAEMCRRPMASEWVFTDHPADRFIEDLQALRRLSSPIPIFSPEHSGPLPWTNWRFALAAMTEVSLFGLPLGGLLGERQAEQRRWRAAEAAERARHIEEARLAEERRQREEGAAFLADLEERAGAICGSPEAGRAWTAEQLEKLVPGGDSIIPKPARQALSQALDRMATVRAAAERDAAETRELISLILGTRSPVFVDGDAAEAWLRSPRALNLPAGNPLPVVLPTAQRALLRAALDTTVEREQARRLAEAEAAAVAAPEVVALRAELRRVAVERWGSEEKADKWLTQGRLADAYQKPISRCRDDRSFSDLLKALDADILASKLPPAPTRRRR